MTFKSRDARFVDLLAGSSRARDMKAKGWSQGRIETWMERRRSRRIESLRRRIERLP